MWMISGEEIYGLSFSSNLGVLPKADSTPLGLFVYSDGKWHLIENKNLYKLSEEDFKKEYVPTNVYNFMRERC